MNDGVHPAPRRRPSSASSGAARAGLGAPLVTLRNNFDNASWTQYLEGPFRVPRPYVQKCCKGSLGLYYSGDRVVFKALPCGSWSCPQCRKTLAARTLNRLRGGMGSREANRIFVTLTINPANYGGKVIGQRAWDDGRVTNLWAPPTKEQFEEAAWHMSREFKRLMDRLNRKATYAELPRFAYFRVIELHRNGWPHYHVVLEHSTYAAADVRPQLSKWSPGEITDARDVSMDDAVAEVAPYLVNKEGRGKGYQFAASALPKGFNLYTASKGFLAASEKPEDYEPPVQWVTLKGHFSTFHQWARDFGAETRLVLPPPADAGQPYRPPSASLATGEDAGRFFTELWLQDAVKASHMWLKESS